jgi:E3 ubiquitin-protein ligase RNF144
MASSSSSFLGIDDTVDDFYFSVVSDDEIDPDLPVTDDKYAEALQFQETLLASLITSHRIPSSSMSPPPSFPCVASSSQTVHEELLFEETLIMASSSSTLPPPFVASSSKAIDDTVLTEKEADESSIVICEICTEAKRTNEMFRNQRCYHSFCSECVVKQVSTKI